MNKIIYCSLLDCDGLWTKVELKEDEFKFKEYYSRANRNIQIWEAKDKEIFILREVIVK